MCSHHYRLSDPTWNQSPPPTITTTKLVISSVLLGSYAVLCTLIAIAVVTDCALLYEVVRQRHHALRRWRNSQRDRRQRQQQFRRLRPVYEGLSAA
ncbi:uncharacterized protein PG986_005684 [Apiospora aurea]|uniref:Copper transporter n=1 Tax=Apiospora aurea TaxID=335848 RepID=A0ABR1QI91_9PEZI